MLTQRDKNILRHLEDHEAITIFQCYQLFFRDSRYGFDLARKRLKQLETMKYIRHYTNTATKEYVYYIDHKLSAHDLYIMNFYSTLIYEGAKVLQFKKLEPFMNGLIIADAFIEYIYGNYVDDVIVEVDLTHSPNMQEYERLYQSKELQKECGGEFPLLVVVSDKGRDYSSNIIKIIQLDSKLTKLKEKVLVG